MVDVIRDATYNDIDDIIELWVEMQTDLFNKIKGINEIKVCKDKNSRRPHYEFVLSSALCKVIVMEKDKKLVGFIETCINEKDNTFTLDRYGYVAYVYVKEGFRSAQDIIDMYHLIEMWLIQNNVNYVCSDVDGENIISAKLQSKFFGFKPLRILMAKTLNKSI